MNEPPTVREMMVFNLICLLSVFVTAGAEATHQRVQLGEDEAGRPCMMKLTPSLEVQIENEWYGRAEKVVFVPTHSDSSPTQRTGRLGATLHARSDNTPAELDLELRFGQGTYFTLVLPSATGYAHGCRFAAPGPERAH